MYQFAISSKTRLQCLLLSAAIHTLIYVSALEFGLEDGLIIPGFWVRIPEGPPGFSTGQAICLACFLFSGNIFLQVAFCPLPNALGWVSRMISATKPAHLLRLSPTPRPHPVYSENRRPSTCGFIFAQDCMVGRCRPNVVDGPVSWREVPGRRPDLSRKGASRGFAARSRVRIRAPAPRRRKFFQNCPCIAVRVPV